LNRANTLVYQNHYQINVFYAKMSKLPEDTDDWQIDGHLIEEVTDEAHDHRAMGVNLRGLSESQKEIVILCDRRRSCALQRVIKDF
jgi:hypothetical protein